MAISNPHQAWLLFFAAAIAQNLVLTTGLGSALIVRLSRRNENRAVFALCLLLFSVLTALCFHLISPLLENGDAARFLSPLVIVALSAAWYLIAVGVLRKTLPRLYDDLRSVLPFAAINTIVTGVTLIAPHQFGESLTIDLALAAGAAIGFFLVSLLVAEGVDRMQHIAIPKAFAGLPALFLYLGILALALCGFSSDISFI